jgi:hypothetical protein
MRPTAGIALRANFLNNGDCNNWVIKRQEIGREEKQENGREMRKWEKR